MVWAKNFKSQLKNAFSCIAVETKRKYSDGIFNSVQTKGECKYLGINYDRTVTFGYHSEVVEKI